MNMNNVETVGHENKNGTNVLSTESRKYSKIFTICKYDLLLLSDMNMRTDISFLNV